MVILDIPKNVVNTEELMGSASPILGHILENGFWKTLWFSLKKSVQAK